MSALQHPHSDMDIQHTAKVLKGYTPSYRGLWQYEDPGPQNPVLVQASLEAEWMKVRCVHCDVLIYLLVLLEIKYKGKNHSAKAAASLRLTHSLILGRDLPG